MILIKKQRQDRDIVPDKGFKMLVDGPLDHGALSRNLYFVFREQMIRLAELRMRERDRHWRIMDYAEGERNK